jgi:hypothetical protein
MKISLAKALAYVGIALIVILIVIASVMPHVKFNPM